MENKISHNRPIIEQLNEVFGILPKNHKKKLVFICSPFRPISKNPFRAYFEKRNNIATAKKMCILAIKEGYLPFAPHLFAPQFLNDNIEFERDAGIEIGLTILSKCDEIWYLGTRISKGMECELAEAKKLKIMIKNIDDRSL